MNQKYICTWGIFLLLSFSFFLNAQETLQFRHLNATHGLSSNQVNAIYKDSHGFMWLGTQSGLNRYDGYRMKVYYASQWDGAWGNAVTEIREDARGYLWLRIRTDGYILFDPVKEVFVKDYTEEMAELGIPGEEVRFIYLDSQKNLWVYGDSRLYYYGFQEEKLRIFEQTDRAGDISPGEITGMTQRDQTYYLIHRSGLIEAFDLAQGKVVVRDEHLVHHFPLSGESLSLFVDSREDIWVYSHTNRGLCRKDAKHNRWEYLARTSTRQTLSHDLIVGIVEDNRGNIWIATDPGGVNIYHYETGQLTVATHDADVPSSIGSNGIVSIYKDDQEIIWLGSFKRGISYYSEVFQKFHPHNLTVRDDENVYKLEINALDEDKRGDLWLGTDGNGMVRMDSRTGKMQHYAQQGGNGPTPGNVVVCFLCDSQDRLWMGTYLDGLICYDRGQFTHYKESADSRSLTDNNVWAIEEDRHGIVWIGTLRGGLQSYDPRKKRFETFDTGRTDECILDLYGERGKYLYVGTVYGLGILDTDTRKYERLMGNRKGTQVFADRFINCLYKDSRGLLWLGGNQGLSIFDERADTIYYLDHRDGLYENVVCGIVEDDAKNMWILTGSGLTYLIMNHHPIHKTFEWSHYNYDEMDGLLGNNFNGRSIYKASDGQILIGGAGGYTRVNPSHMAYNHYLPRVTFTGLRIGNETIEVDSIYRNRIILHHSLNERRRIDLDHKNNIFFIEYSALDYAQPAKTHYAYMVEGMNADWIYTRESYISFTNLRSGKYLLKIKAANSDGLWNEHPETLLIVIHPPFWASNLAYVLYSLLFIALCCYFIWQGKRKNAEKLRIQRIEMEAERQHTLDELKLRFFTNISHDFRTPLSLVITPVEKMLEEYENTEVAEKLKTVHRNAGQLLNLVNQLLDFRKLDVQRESLHLSHGDYVAFCKEVCESFVVFAERKDIHIRMDTDVEKLEMSFDRDKVRKILMNLLSNAFKYTSEGGAVTVHISEYLTGGQEEKRVSVAVSDTGIGIPDEDKPFIFDRFYQVAQPKLNYGSGIGLHIVDEFVKLHGGTVTVCDNHPQGTVFSFSIPIRISVAVSASEQDSLEMVTTDEEEERAGLATPEATPVILLIEDNKEFREFVADSLKDTYCILQAGNGAEGLKVLRTENVDVIICDVMMPVMDGLELCNKVKTDIRLSHIPVILLTARTTDEHKLKGLKEGADDYITKPFNLHILKLRVRKFLDWNRKNHEKFRQKADIAPSEITISSLDEKLLVKAIKIVEENMTNTEFSVEQFSSRIGMSRGHLYKKLVSITGKTPIEFIRIIRLKRARQLLEKSQMNVSEVAYEVGFNSPKIFTRHFRDEFNITPSEYIKYHKQDP
ncbi:MAG: response regulator [Bacteroides sp.]|nr:response regulator [Bacteroides sp.]